MLAHSRIENSSVDMPRGPHKNGNSRATTASVAMRPPQ